MPGPAAVLVSGAELAELEAGIAEADRDELVPGDEFLEELKRFERQ
jgi:predicted transcriptional regulator